MNFLDRLIDWLDPPVSNGSHPQPKEATMPRRPNLNDPDDVAKGRVLVHHVGVAAEENEPRSRFQPAGKVKHYLTLPLTRSQLLLLNEAIEALSQRDALAKVRDFRHEIADEDTWLAVLDANAALKVLIHDELATVYKRINRDAASARTTPVKHQPAITAPVPPKPTVKCVTVTDNDGVDVTDQVTN